MDLVIDRRGVVRCLYNEAIDLRKLGEPQARRAAHVEPGPGGWLADLRPSGGPVLGPFSVRSAALAAEMSWLGAKLVAQTLPASQSPPAGA